MDDNARQIVPAVSASVTVETTDSPGRAMAKVIHRPHTRHAAIANHLASAMFTGGASDLSDAVAEVKEHCEAAADGDLAMAAETLTAQAMTLDAIFTDLVRKASASMGDYPHVGERYMRLALKAQANSRATIEALAKLSRGGEQVVRHIHVDNRGGQAVIANTVNTGGANGILSDQSHAQSASGAALLGTDATGYGVPISSDAERQMSHAWRSESGGSEGE